MAVVIDPEIFLEECDRLDSHVLTSNRDSLLVEVPNENYKVYWQRDRNVLYFATRVLDLSNGNFVFDQIPFHLPGPIECYGLIKDNLVVIYYDSQADKFYLTKFSYNAKTEQLTYRTAAANKYESGRIFYSMFSHGSNSFIIVEQKDKQLIPFRRVDTPKVTTDPQVEFDIDGNIEIEVNDDGNVYCFFPSTCTVTLEKK